MIGRVVAIAVVVAGLMLAGGVAAWNARVGGVRSTFDSRVTLASALISGPAKPADLAHSLAADELRIAVEDHVNNIVYEAREGRFLQRNIPPIPPDAPPPPIPAARPSDIERFVGSALGRPVQRVGDPFGVSAVIGADLAVLVRFLIADVLVTFALLIVIVAATVWIVTGLVRAARKQLEGMLAERNAAAKEYQRFLADAGHELRTPLTIVSWYVDILSGEFPAPDVVQQILTGLRTETARMRALVEKMLLLGRLDSASAIPRLVDVADVARDVSVQMRARYPGREIALRTQSAMIIADQDDVYEAVRNLVENALRYAPRSPVEIEILADASGATIAVIDRGEGIAEGERTLIFERFYRGRSRTDGEGSGLGLAIVSRVAKQWNGAIDVESRPGRTMFALRFPLAEEEPARVHTR
jgi:signal transduction histidine kinase